MPTLDRVGNELRFVQESRARYSEAGFTLFEMLVALALLAFAMAIALPTLKTSNSGASLKAVALSLAADLKAARVSAVMRGMPISVRFLAQPRVYLRDGEREPTRLPQSIAMTLFPRDGILPEAGGPAITFFPDGSSTGGLVILSEAVTTYQVTVDWLTGAVAAEERKA